MYTMTPKKQKILYVITKSNFGGAQRYVFDLATSLPKEHFDVLVAFGEGSLLGEKLETAGIRTIHIDSLKRDINMFGEIKVLRELIRIFKTEKPDVVHLNSSKVGGLGGLAGRLARVPHIIFTGHGWAFNENRSSFSKFIISILHWFTIVLSHKTIAVSKKTADQISVFPLIKKKIVTIYNGIPKNEFETKESARAFLASKNPSIFQNPKALWIGTISELHVSKGLDYMIDALSEVIKTHPEVQFVVIGEGEKRNELKKMIIEQGLQNNFFLLGFITDARQYLKAFDIFTLTSRTEGFPYVILEAGQAALPTIASHVGGIPEVITDLSTGILIWPYRPHDIAKAIRFLIENPKKRTEYGRALKHIVDKEFNQELMVEKTLELYKKSVTI
jgi:glycosyltransferase involved in cell wall biosynthesis